MIWTLTQSQNSSRALMISRRSFMRAAFVSVFCSAWLLPFSSSLADDRLSVADLSEEEFDELAALSVGLRAVAASSSGNITNDVAAILAFLQSLKSTSTSFIRIRTEPYISSSTANINFGMFFNRLLGEGSGANLPAKNQSYLWQIRELLKTFPTNYPASDASWTNSVLSSISDIRSDQSTQFSSLYQVLNSIYSVNSHSDMYLASAAYNTDYLVSLFGGPFVDNMAWTSNYLASFEYSPGLWHTHLDSSQLNDILDALEAIRNLQEYPSWSPFNDSSWQSFSNDITFDLSLIEDYLLDIDNSVSATLPDIEDYTRWIHSDDLAYDGTGRSVQSDFRFLQQQIGVEHPSPSNNLYSALVGTPLQQLSWSRQLNAATNSFNAESDRSEQSASNAVSQSEADIAAVAATNNLDYERHWYQQSNPVDELGGLGSSALHQFENAMPDMPDATDWTITLFNGNFPVYSVDSSSTRSAGSLSSQNVHLNISYALRDNDAVSGGLSTMNGIMEVVWDLCELVLILWMYKRFYDDVVSGNFERM